jgi:hypothetical protein
MAGPVHATHRVAKGEVQVYIPMQISGLSQRAYGHLLLEPISKLFEEDNEAGKLDKAKEIVGVVLPENEDPALPLNPGEETLDEPASHVAT